MKFGKSLIRVVDTSDPEWGPYWINYKFLKKKINVIVEAQGGQKITDHNLACNPGIIAKSSCEVDFFRLLKSEVKKTSDFYASSEQIYRIRKERIWQGFSMLNDERMVLDKNTWTRLLMACVRFYKDVLLLENFAIMNYCAASKILKKHDKMTGFVTRDAFMRNVMNQQNFTHYPYLLELIKESEKLFDEIQQMESVMPLQDEERMFIDAIRDLNQQVTIFQVAEKQESGDDIGDEESDDEMQSTNNSNLTSKSNNRHDICRRSKDAKERMPTTATATEDDTDSMSNDGQGIQDIGALGATDADAIPAGTTAVSTTTITAGATEGSNDGNINSVNNAHPGASAAASSLVFNAASRVDKYGKVSNVSPDLARITSWMKDIQRENSQMLPPATIPNSSLLGSTNVVAASAAENKLPNVCISHTSQQGSHNDAGFELSGPAGKSAAADRIAQLASVTAQLHKDRVFINAITAASAAKSIKTQSLIAAGSGNSSSVSNKDSVEQHTDVEGLEEGDTVELNHAAAQVDVIVHNSPSSTCPQQQQQRQYQHQQQQYQHQEHQQQSELLQSGKRAREQKQLNIKERHSTAVVAVPVGGIHNKKSKLG